MGKREVRTEYIRKAIEELKKLREECEEYYKEEREVNAKEQGAVHNALDEACVVMSDTWKEFIILINKTMEFLGEAVDTYEIPDKQSASNISSSQTSFGGGNGGGFR